MGGRASRRAGERINAPARGDPRPPDTEHRQDAGATLYTQCITATARGDPRPPDAEHRQDAGATLYTQCITATARGDPRPPDAEHRQDAGATVYTLGTAHSTHPRGCEMGGTGVFSGNEVAELPDQPFDLIRIGYCDAQGGALNPGGPALV